MKCIPKTIFALLFIICFIRANAQRIKIIPEPASITEKNGSFVFSNTTKLINKTSDTLVAKTIRFFKETLNSSAGIQLKTGEDSDTSGAVIVSLNSGPFVNNKEGYILDVRRDRIKITAASSPGVFYAFQSLLQMLPVISGNKTGANQKVPCAYIIDSPQYAYRGMHLDVSRHFFPVSFIKHYIDILASFKINVFHWHLTDSHGWRLEIKQYPRLTAVGAWRADRTGIPMTIAKATQPEEPASYGGFYTQEEVKEIIRYAQQRNITIIPEIEMPGHCTAALVAYPKYSDLNNKNPLLMPCGYPGDLQHNFCAGYDSTYIFLQNILKEVMALFPSDYIHIGGDEVRPEPWMNCPRCQQKMKEKAFTTAHQLQAYFTARIDSFITANGKKMMGWDEIVGADIARSSVNMSWHGESKATEAAAKGNATVMTPYRYTYFDFYQSDPRLEPDISYAKLQIDTVYHFNPMPKAFTSEHAKKILGGEACLWTENVSTPQRVEYMLLPRLMALSEAVWTPSAKKNYTKFIAKTEAQFKRFEAAGINYAKSMYNVNIQPTFDSVAKTITVKLADQTYQYPIRYTSDGTDPGLQSPAYTKPVVITKSAVLKTATFNNAKQLGKTNIETFIIHKAIGAALIMLPANEALKRMLDGILGTVEPYDARWVMMTDSVNTITVDMEKQQLLHSFTVRFMEDQVGNLYLPKSVKVSISTDNIHYKNAFALNNTAIPQQLLRHVVKYDKPLQQTARFVKVEIRNANLNATADKNIMMLDEIVIQ